MNALLPDGFAPLEPFAADWAVAGSAARAARRGDADPAARDRRLTDMMLTLAPVSLTEEILGDQEPSRLRRHRRITRTPAGV